MTQPQFKVRVYSTVKNAYVQDVVPFDTIDMAYKFAATVPCHAYQVYDQDGIIVKHGWGDASAEEQEAAYTARQGGKVEVPVEEPVVEEPVVEEPVVEEPVVEEPVVEEPVVEEPVVE